LSLSSEEEDSNELQAWCITSEAGHKRENKASGCGGNLAGLVSVDCSGSSKSTRGRNLSGGQRPGWSSSGSARVWIKDVGTEEEALVRWRVGSRRRRCRGYDSICICICADRRTDHATRAARIIWRFLLSDCSFAPSHGVRRAH